MGRLQGAGGEGVESKKPENGLHLSLTGYYSRHVSRSVTFLEK